jgi:hypothetical protein
LKWLSYPKKTFEYKGEQIRTISGIVEHQLTGVNINKSEPEVISFQLNGSSGYMILKRENSNKKPAPEGRVS